MGDNHCDGMFVCEAILVLAATCGAFYPCPIASFDDWWRSAISLVPNTLKKGLDSHYFGSLTIWKHHNDRVFDGKSPSLSVALIMAGDELCFWNLAKAKGLSLLIDSG